MIGRKDISTQNANEVLEKSSPEGIQNNFKSYIDKYLFFHYKN